MDTENPRDRARCLNSYIECAEWADWPTDDQGREASGSWDAGYETAMAEDLFAFLDDPAVAADVADLEPEQVGHDFWLTRNGHGAGFWDRGLGEVGERLSDAARVYGSFYLEELVTLDAEQDQ